MKVLDLDGLEYYNSKIEDTYLPLAGGEIDGDLTVTGTITGDVTGTASGNLPLSGGTMTGELKFYGTGTISVTQLPEHGDEGALIFYGGHNQSSGAAMLLCGKDAVSSSGDFALQAKDGTYVKTLTGKPDGTLTWDSQPIARFDSNGKLVFPNGNTIWFT